MSSKKKHAKSKVLTRKEKKMRVNNVVKAANSVPNPLSKFCEYERYDRHSLDLHISYCRSLAEEKDAKDLVWDLLKSNMQKLYEQSSWGWKEQDKMSELTHEHARFLLVRDGTNRLVAFSHFRFEVDENYPVLYCYELQIHQDIQRKGLGQYLMHLLSLIALDLQMTKIMLTVFKFNQSAMDFYVKRLGFRLDETSPPANSTQCYLILSKYVDKKNCVFV